MCNFKYASDSAENCICEQDGGIEILKEIDLFIKFKFLSYTTNGIHVKDK